MQISLERKESVGGNAMHFMGCSFLCSEHLKKQKSQFGFWFSDFGPAGASKANVVGSVSQEPTTLPPTLWHPLVDVGVGMVALIYAGIFILRGLNIF